MNSVCKVAALTRWDAKLVVISRCCDRPRDRPVSIVQPAQRHKLICVASRHSNTKHEIPRPKSKFGGKLSLGWTFGSTARTSYKIHTSRPGELFHRCPQRKKAVKMKKKTVLNMRWTCVSCIDPTWYSSPLCNNTPPIRRFFRARMDFSL